MKQLRLPFIIVLVLAVGLLGGMVLEMHVLSRIGSPAQTVEQRPTTEGKGDTASLASGLSGGFPSTDGGFGSGPDGREFPPAETYEPPLQAWIEVRFIEIATADLDTITIGDGAAAIRADEKLLLTPEERRQLLGQLKSRPSYRVITSASVTSISGNQAIMEFEEDLPYLTERDEKATKDAESERTKSTEEATKQDGDVSAIRCWPALELEELGLGTRLNVTPTISYDRQTMTIVLLPEIARISGWADFGTGPLQPLYWSCDMNATIFCLDGMSVLMPCVPLGGHGGTAHPHVKPSDDRSDETTVLVLVTARIIELPVQPPEPDVEPAEAPAANSNSADGEAEDDSSF